MTNIKQVMEDMSPEAIAELLIYRSGYPVHQVNEWSERKMRATMEGDYKDGLLSGRDIREMAEGA